jgi:hypothetical protein
MPAIRLIGEHHPDGRVLTVADEVVARTDPNTVTLEHAGNLVASGEAEWVGEPEHDSGTPAPVVTLAEEPQQDHPEETKPS